MDGTIYLGEDLLSGAKELLKVLWQKELDYLFLTNNSSKHSAQYVEKLAQFNIHINKKKILTSGEATAI